MAVLYNLSCWESNTNKLLDYCVLESISEVLSTSKQSMTELLDASSYFDPLAIATLVNLCRKGVCTVYSYGRWKKVIGLTIESFKGMMKHNQLQIAPPTNICYEFCSINDWDLARSLVALFVNCLTMEPRWSKMFRSNWVDEEMIDLLLQYAQVVDLEGHILLGFLFCLIYDGDKRPYNAANSHLVLEQIVISTRKMATNFPLKFCSYMWTDVTAVHALAHSKLPQIREWNRVFLEASAKIIFAWFV